MPKTTKTKTLSAFSGWKRRAIEANEVASGIDRSKDPSNKELCVTLLGGEDKIAKEDHVDGSKRKVYTGWTVDSQKKVVWIGGNGWSNPVQRLTNIYGGKERLIDAYYALKTAEAKGAKESSDIQYAIKVATGHSPEVTSAMGWLEMIVDKNW